MNKYLLILFFSFFCIGTLQAQKRDSSAKATKTQPAKTKQKKADAPKPKTTTTPIITPKNQAKQAVPGKKVAAPTNKPIVNKNTTQKKDTIKPKTAQPVVKKAVPKQKPKQDSIAKKKTDTAQKNIARDTTRVVKKVKKPLQIIAKKDSANAIRNASVKPDSAKLYQAKADSIKIVTDSLQKNIAFTALKKNISLSRKILQTHPYFAIQAAPVISPFKEKEVQIGKEIYFYTLAGIILFFAGFKTAFSKYFDDLTTLFFKRTLKQRQLQQQLSQNTLPSLLFNIIFTLTAGFYIALMAQEVGNIKLPYPFWQLFSFAVIAIAIIYLGKFFLIKLLGWLFHIEQLTDAYIFLIFLVNKIIALFLLPVIIVAALGGTGLKTIIWTLSWLILSVLFIYRFIVALRLVRKNTKVSAFHFFIYFIALELLPAFVIYKVILHFLK